MGQVCIPSTSDSKPGNNMPQHCSLLKGEGKIDPLSRTLCFWETSSSCPSWCKKSQAHCTPISLNILSTSEGCGNGWKIPVCFKAPGLWSVADGIKNTFGGQILGGKKAPTGAKQLFPIPIRVHYLWCKMHTTGFKSWSCWCQMKWVFPLK